MCNVSQLIFTVLYADDTNAFLNEKKLILLLKPLI